MSTYGVQVEDDLVQGNPAQGASAQYSPAQSEPAQYSSARSELRCRECGKSWGNQARSICHECFSPLEITYDYDAIRGAIVNGTFSREKIAQRPPNMWRYSELLPLPASFEPRLPVGFTPFLPAPRLAARLA